MKNNYIITGMSCAACSARVEKAVKKLDGVDNCAVNLLTNSMSVEGSIAPEIVIAAVEKAGYGAKLKDNARNLNSNKNNEEDLLEDKDTPVLKRRLIFSLGFLILLMYFAMGHSMFNLPLPEFF
nr:cation transporter [Synergistaceae bacterium]